MPQNSDLNTAVLVFAYSPSEEVLHKPIPKGAKLYCELTKQTLNTVEKSGLPYFHFTEQEQKGSTFGERFTNAIKAVFDNGYEKVITIGNDSPLLKSPHILSASTHLDNGEFVVGPSMDGGFYLMGIHKSQFDARTFENLPWQTTQTATALLHLIEKNNNPVVSLEILADLDCVSDLKDFLRYSSKIPIVLIKLIFSIIGIKSHNITYSDSDFNKSFTQDFYNKGSPLLSDI